MQFPELRGLSREAYLNQQIAELRKVYKTVQDRLVTQLRRADLTDFSRARAQQLLQQVNVLEGVLTRSARNWAKKALPVAYDRGFDLAAERLKALGVTRFADPNAKIHTAAVNVMIDDVTVQLLTVNNGMKQFISRVVLRTQQRAIEDAEISRLIGEGLVEGGTRRQVSDAILKELNDALGAQQFLQIKGRNYRPDKYAELVARTRTREATSQAVVNTSLRYGVDLVQFDAHSEPCPYCQQFSGRVYSISGSDASFPPLQEMPPLHPNCKCVIVPVTQNALERRGSLDAIIDLSNSPLTEVDSFKRFEEILAEA